MHGYQDSVTCCREFANTFEKKTGQEYKKSSNQINTMLNHYGNESEAIKIAESRYAPYLRDGIDKPSGMCPCTTVHRLVDEIKDKVERSISKLLILPKKNNAVDKRVWGGKMSSYKTKRP